MNDVYWCLECSRILSANPETVQKDALDSCFEQHDRRIVLVDRETLKDQERRAVTDLVKMGRFTRWRK